MDEAAHRFLSVFWLKNRGCQSIQRCPALEVRARTRICHNVCGLLREGVQDGVWFQRLSFNQNSGHCYRWYWFPLPLRATLDAKNSCDFMRIDHILYFRCRSELFASHTDKTNVLKRNNVFLHSMCSPRWFPASLLSCAGIKHIFY